jgi:hypothetical protein
LTYSKPPDFCQTSFAVPPTVTQYVRMHSFKRLPPPAGDIWGISIFEFEVYGTTASTAINPSSLVEKASSSNLNFIRTKDGISIKANASGNLSADIFSPNGQAVRHLSGKDASFWNYKDAYGRSVTNGTYLLRVTSAGKTVQDKITVNR